MTETVDNSNEICLWECLHDGTLESLSSDLMLRTITLVVDVPFHWEHHKLSTETRFKIVGENVRVAEAFDFEPWLGAIEPAADAPWKEAHELRQRNREKGRLISADWNAFAADIQTNEDHVILDAKLRTNQPLAIIELGIMDNSNYRTMMTHAESVRFYVGGRELELEEFLTFGNAYWKAWSENNAKQDRTI